MGLLEKWNGILDEVIQQCKSLTGLEDKTVGNSFNAGSGTVGFGTLRAVQLTGLEIQQYIDSIDLEVNVANGNVRVKLYTDAEDSPDLFLGESDSLPITSTGTINLRLLKQVEVPIDGQVWVAIETDSATLEIDQSTGQSSGTEYTLTHTFGAGPDPWSGGSAGTSPFWTQVHYDPKVVKYNGVRGKQVEDFFAVVFPQEMNIEALTNRGSNNVFVTLIDLSYRGVDFQNASTKLLTKASEIYDKIHMTTLNGQVQRATVDIFIDEVIEGENLYMASARLQITAPKVVVQS